MVLEYLKFVLLLSTHVDLQSEYQGFKAKTLRVKSSDWRVLFYSQETVGAGGGFESLHKIIKSQIFVNFKLTFA